MASTAAYGAGSALRRLGQRRAHSLAGGQAAATSAILSARSRVFGGACRVGVLARERNRGLTQIAVHDAIDDACLERACGRDRLAVGAHLERQRRAAQPRQTLGAAGAGDDAEQHFGLADARVASRDAVVTAHGDFVAAAERDAVDGGDDRLGGSPRDASAARACRRDRSSDCSRVFSVAKTLMSAPAMNVVPAPMRTMASTAGSSAARATASSSRLPDGWTQRVDRRVVDRDDGDAVDAFVADEIGIRHRDRLPTDRMNEGRVHYHAPCCLRFPRRPKRTAAAAGRVHGRAHLSERGGVPPAEGRRRSLAADAASSRS